MITEKDDRQRFESWISRATGFTEFPTRKDGREYVDPALQLAWRTWNVAKSDVFMSIALGKLKL